ncbi:capsid assembly scaffolding protein Gp46 family protein [Mycobacteroides chelonae]|uniref:capsid assembly scaffolding protein Gp46 family protein n=1 Tax=Mycobacteroides chelonae TaxID=1774 RepID=UPI001E5ED9BA|nr:DUF4355 domain-containing protein [Mycobacteroides chelonae]
MHRNKFPFLFTIEGTESGAGGGGTDNNGGTPAGGTPSNDDAGKKFTQADLDRIVGERLARANTTILQTLGVDSLDDAKAGLADLKTRKDSEKDAAQLAADQLAEANDRAAKAEARAAAAERTQAGIDAGLPLALAKRLTSDDPAALAAEIEELKPFAGAAAGTGARTPAPTDHQGRHEGGGSTTLSTVNEGAELYKKLHPAK